MDSTITSTLTVLGGPLAKRAFPLASGGLLRIGSDPDCEVRLSLPGVERIHARITLQIGGGAVVEDASSRVGVYVNDNRVSQATVLHDSDILWLGAPGAPESVMLQFGSDRPATSKRGESLAAPATPPPIEDFFVAEVAEIPKVVDRPATESPKEFMIDDSGVDFESKAPLPKKTDTQPIPSIAPDEFFISEAETPAVSAGENMFMADETDGAFSIDEKATLAEAKPEERPPRPLAEVGGAAGASTGKKPEKATPPPARIPPGARQSAASAPAARNAGATAHATPVRKAPPIVPGSERMRGPRAPSRPAFSQRATPRSVPGRARPLQRQARRTTSPARLAALLVIVAVIVAAVAYLAFQHLEAPKIETVTPSPARVGEELTIVGRNFSSDSAANAVLFGEQAADVIDARPTRLVVKVPEMPLSPGHVSTVAIRVRSGARESSSLDVSVYLPPRIRGISPDVGMPGEEVVIAGAGWTSVVGVFFGNAPAEVLAAEATYVRVRVPAIIVSQGTSIPVVIAAGEERSNSVPFIMGKLPLMIGTDPESAAAGDVVTLMGRGFRSSPADNVVRVGGVRALILEAREDAVQFVVPRLDLAGRIPIEVLVPGRGSSALGILDVRPSIDPVPFQFIPEPFVDEAGHSHAVLVTGVGPAFVISASGGMTAAQRALKAAQRFNAAASLIRASRDIDIEIADMESEPRLLLTGRSDPLIEVTTEDVMAYTKDWTGQKGQGGLITAARLATWWRALARDLVLMLVRAEPPRHAAAIASEGRILVDLYQRAVARGGYGVTRSMLAELSPAEQDALRVLAYRVPSSVMADSGTAATVTETMTETTETTTAPTALRLDRQWRGKEVAEGRTRAISVVFEGNAGTLTYEGGVALSVPVLDLEQPRPDAVTFMAEAGGGVRYYAGQWDGRKVRGTISSQPSGTGDLGTFELAW